MDATAPEGGAGGAQEGGNTSVSERHPAPAEPGALPAAAGAKADLAQEPSREPPLPPAPSDPPAVAAGASGAEQDHLRATVRVSGRAARPPQIKRTTQGPRPPAAPQPAQASREAELSVLLESGRALLEQDPRGAHGKFEAAYRLNLNDVRALSLYGLTLVMVEGDRQRGIRFIEEAVRRGPVTTEMLVSLARALILTRNKEQAVRALRRAQELSPDDPRVSAEFAALGLRRRPPIPWLPRWFFLNKWIGQLTWHREQQRKARLQLSGTRLAP